LYSTNKIKIAIVGTHVSGKTSICYDVVAELKKMNLRADVAREASRLSYYLAADIRNFEMQLDLLTRHVSEELESLRTSDIVICDRSVIDIWAYTQNLPHEELSKKEKIYIDSMEEFIKHYVDSYDIIFRKNTFYDVLDSKDVLLVGSADFQQKILDDINYFIEKQNVNVIDIDDSNAKKQIVESILTLWNS
jgi:hypothetical protein